MKPIVVMGVSGCGKSTVAARLAAAFGVPMIEGDAFHSEANRDKMRRGIPLDDADRAGWLATLGQQLAEHPEGVILTCSALKRSYRDALREHCPGVRFLFLEITLEDALARVAARLPNHFFPPSLVQSQFADLEVPTEEGDVLSVRATDSVDKIVCEVLKAFADSH